MSVKTSFAHVLCVEDNAGDRLLIKRFFAPQSDHFEIHFLEDGAEALDFAFKRGKHASAPTPDLVILDLNLQRVDGKEVLVALKKSSQTDTIPVVILTTSKSFEEKCACLAMGADHFFTKPSDITSFQEILRYIQAWIEEKKIDPPKGKPPVKFGGMWEIFPHVSVRFRPAL